MLSLRSSACWIGVLLSAGCTTAPPTKRGLPWMVRRTVTGEDGKQIEVLGAPGPRTLAIYLHLHYDGEPIEAAFAKVCDREGLLLQDVYAVTSYSNGDLRVRLQGHWARASEWSGTHLDLLDDPAWLPEHLARRCSLADLAVLRNDVFWRWPIPEGTEWTVMHPTWRADVVGPIYVRLLRQKIARGMTKSDAFLELRFLASELTYTMSMPSEGLLRVMTNGYSDAWEGAY